MRHTLRFLGEVATHWRQTGALVPSSPRLARVLAQTVGDLRPDQVVIELGPGSGSITVALAERFARNRVVAVEFNERLADAVQRRCPRVEVVAGCASQLRQHLEERGIAPTQVGAVVSSLPLLVMPRELVEAIFRSVAEVTPTGARFLQYTYSRKAWRRFAPIGFRPEPPRRVWLNIPPAVVLSFVREHGHGTRLGPAMQGQGQGQGQARARATGFQPVVA
jgi:phosphatidylethanolamine/phosphatidyl-N-methylethanolamine N-methyltransferase